MASSYSFIYSDACLLMLHLIGTAFQALSVITSGTSSNVTRLLCAYISRVCRRLDYFVLSERLLPNLCDSIIRKEVYGSDHCPLVLLMAMD